MPKRSELTFSNPDNPVVPSDASFDEPFPPVGFDDPEAGDEFKSKEFDPSAPKRPKKSSEIPSTLKNRVFEEGTHQVSDESGEFAVEDGKVTRRL